jgi:N-acetylglucosamine-6-sulfatase
MDIPMNQPQGSSQNKRWKQQGGQHAADFPKALVVEQPLNRDAQ